MFHISKLDHQLNEDIRDKEIRVIDTTGEQLGIMSPRNATAYCEAIIPSTGKVACTAIGTYAVIKKA